MNVFRLAGDMTHLLSIVLLLLKIKKDRNCRGTPRIGARHDRVHSPFKPSIA